jgi:hypothetical protein
MHQRTTQLAKRAALCLSLGALGALGARGLAEPPPGSPGALFFTAVRAGDLAEAKRLLDSGVDVNTEFRYGATALSSACDRGHVEIVRLLLDRGAKPLVRDTFYGSTPIDWAISPAMGKPGENHLKIVEMLLAKGGGERDAVLFAGVDRARPELVRVALAGEPKPSAFDLADALAAATKAQQTDAIAALQAAGAKALPPPSATVSREILARYAGDWVGDGRRAARVTVEATESGLRVRLGPEPSALVAYDDLTFESTGDPKVRLAFTVEGGVARSVRARVPGGVMTLKRAEAAR